MARMIAERDRPAIRCAHAALSAEDEKWLAPNFARIPTHACVLRQTEQVAARSVAQHLLSQRQAAGGSRRFGLDLEDVVAGNRENLRGQTHKGLEFATARAEEHVRFAICDLRLPIGRWKQPGK